MKIVMTKREMSGLSEQIYKPAFRASGRVWSHQHYTIWFQKP
jgi:hypothetical protein